MSKLAIIFLIGLLQAGCSGSGERTLPNGYKWLSIYGDKGVISDATGEVIVGMEVSLATLKIRGDQIYGVRKVEQPVGNPPTRTREISGLYGSFALNTKDGEVSFVRYARNAWLLESGHAQ